MLPVFERSLSLEENTHSATVRSVVLQLESVTDKNTCTIYQHTNIRQNFHKWKIRKQQNLKTSQFPVILYVLTAEQHSSRALGPWKSYWISGQLPCYHNGEINALLQHSVDWKWVTSVSEGVRRYVSDNLYKLFLAGGRLSFHLRTRAVCALTNQTCREASAI